MKYIFTRNLNEFYKLNLSAVKRAIRSLFKTMDDEQHDEILFRVFMRTEKIIASYEPNHTACFSTYFNRCIENACSTMLRDAKRLKRAATVCELTDDLGVGYEDAFEQEAKILSEFEALDPMEKQCVKLRCQGYALSEVCGMTGMSHGYISKRYSDFRDRILLKG